MPTWSQLSPEQQCVLLGAAERDLLIDLLVKWEPGLDWSGRVAHVPRLARAVIELVNMGLVEVYQAPNVHAESVLVLPKDVPAVVNEPGNWYGEDGTLSIVELVDADAAGPVLASSGGDIYSYRNHA